MYYFVGVWLLDEAKDDVAHLLVHDMKNPLFVTQGNLQMLSMSIGDENLKKSGLSKERTMGSPANGDTNPDRLATQLCQSLGVSGP